MLKPPAVRPNAVVGVVATASPVKTDFVERGVAELEGLGLRPRIAPHLYARGRYTAGTPQERRDDLLSIWEDPDVEAVFCARGGYGTMELLTLLDPERFRERPKVLVGASDVTALLAFLGARAGVVSFHGPMVAQRIARGGYDAAQLSTLIRSREPVGLLEAPGSRILHDGASEGVLLGGCLSLLVALVGTPFLPSFDDAILFLEDTQVKPYQLDRMLTHLRLAGRLDSVRGIVFGQMPGCEQHPDQGYTLPELLKEWTSVLDVPVLYGFPSGHTESNAMTLPLGVRARLDAEGLHVLEGAVS